MKLSLKSLGSHRKQLLAALVSMSVLFALQPFLWRLVESRATDLKVKRSQQQQIEDVNARNSLIRSGIKEQQDLLDQLDVVVPPQGSLTAIVERLEQLADAQSSLLDISSIVEPAGAEVKQGELVPVKFSLQVRGTSDRLFDYLSSLEHIQELVVVESWALSSGGAGGSGSVVQPYTMTVEATFFLRTE